MNRNGKQDYITRMYLRDVKGWTKKMIEELLKDVKYKKWGNFYRKWNNKTICHKGY